MNLHLTGKRALVTGSSIGIGEAIAKALAAEGVFVAVHGRDEQRAKRVVREIAKSGGRAVVVLGDLTRGDEADRVGDIATSRLGGLDILVNNAGGSGKKTPWDETDADAWAETYDRNVLAIIRLVRRLVPPMRQKGWGRVVNISSGAGTLPAPTGADYSASKAAVNNLTVSLAKAVGGDGVTVNAVSPGTILSPKLKKVFRELAQKRGWADNGKGPWAKVEKAVLENTMQVPLARVGRMEEVAHVVTFLCSEQAGYITGANLRVDGGLVPTV